jgi:hypothetical protein
VKNLEKKEEDKNPDVRQDLIKKLIYGLDQLKNLELALLIALLILTTLHNLQYYYTRRPRRVKHVGIMDCHYIPIRTTIYICIVTATVQTWTYHDIYV